MSKQSQFIKVSRDDFIRLLTKLKEVTDGLSETIRSEFQTSMSGDAGEEDNDVIEARALIERYSQEYDVHI